MGTPDCGQAGRTPFSIVAWIHEEFFSKEEPMGFHVVTMRYSRGVNKQARNMGDIIGHGDRYNLRKINTYDNEWGVEGCVGAYR
jgi:hypothetical protein